MKYTAPGGPVARTIAGDGVHSVSALTRWPEKLDGDEVTFNKKRSHRIVLYDPLPRGVGPLDQTRVVVDPSIALKMLEAFALSDAAKAQGAAEGAPPAPAPPPPASSSAPEKKAVAFPDEVDLTQWV